MASGATNATICPGCNRTFKRLRSHWSQSPVCRPSGGLSSISARASLAIDSLVCDDDDDTFNNNPGNDFDAEMTEVAQSILMRVGHSTALKHETKLLKVLNDAHAPHFLVPQILQWASAAHKDGYEFPDQVQKRKKLIRNIENWSGPGAIVPPTKRNVPLSFPPGVTIPATCFDFAAQLKTLLADMDFFGNMHNLDVDPENPFGPYKSPRNVIDCMNAGSLMQRAWQKLPTAPNDYVLGIVLMYDETMLGNLKTSVAPLKFTTCLLNQSARNQARVWRNLQFVNDPSAFVADLELKAMTAAQKSQLRADVFRAGLQSSSMHKTARFLTIFL